MTHEVPALSRADSTLETQAQSWTSDPTGAWWCRNGWALEDDPEVGTETAEHAEAREAEKEEKVSREEKGGKISDAESVQV